MKLGCPYFFSPRHHAEYHVSFLPLVHPSFLEQEHQELSSQVLVQEEL